MVQFGVSILKKIIFLLLIATVLFSSDLKTEQKIYKLIIHALLPNKKDIKVWSDTKSKENLLRGIDDIVYVSSPTKANFVLLSKDKKTNKDVIKFVTNIQLLEAQQNNVVGGFFWQKGRPNILFLRRNLKEHNITLPESMQEYIEDEI